VILPSLSHRRVNGPLGSARARARARARIKEIQSRGLHSQGNAKHCILHEDKDAVIIKAIISNPPARGGDQPLSESSNRFGRPWTRCMNTCIARCANRSRVHTLSSHSRKLHLLPSLWDPFLLSLRLPFTPPRAFCRLDSLADSPLHLRHLSHGGGGMGLSRPVYPAAVFKCRSNAP